MPHIVSINCPHCNAPQSGQASPAGTCECPYCGTKFSLLPTVAPFTPSAGRPPPPRQPAPVGSPAARVVVALAVVILAVAGLGALFWLRTSGSAVSSSGSRTRSPRVYIPRVTSTPQLAPPEVKATAEFTHHRNVRAYGATIYVYGVVKNSCGVAIDKPKVVAVLRDANGREVDTRSGYAERELLPGESSPVSILLTKPPPFASLTFETVARKAFVEPRRAEGLRLETRPPERNMISSWVFKGRVHNEGRTTARFVRILVTALDSEAKIVGLAFGYVEGERLAAGGSARYEVMAHFAGQPAKFELSVEGRPAD